MPSSYTIKCLGCGESFTAKRKHAKCCSARCRNRLSHARRTSSIDELVAKRLVEQLERLNDDLCKELSEATGDDCSDVVAKCLRDQKKAVQDMIEKRKRQDMDEVY